MSIELRAALRACVSACLNISLDDDTIGNHLVLTEVRGAVSAMVGFILWSLQVQDLTRRLIVGCNSVSYHFGTYDHEPRDVYRSQGLYHVVAFMKLDGLT